jgi:hypothetical protein
MNVLRGMSKILSEKRALLLSFEYGLNWHQKFHWSEAGKNNLTHDTFDGPTLRGMVRLLDSYGYNGYLMHGFAQNETYRLIPISGDFWNNWYELCFNAFQVLCWNDVFFVRADLPCLTLALANALGFARSLKSINAGCPIL